MTDRRRCFFFHIFFHIFFFCTSFLLLLRLFQITKLRKLNVAKDIMSEFSSSTTESPADIQFKWKQLGDLALTCGEMELSKKCAEKAGDLSGLLLMYSAYGDRKAMGELATKARQVGKFNVAFAAAYILGDVHQCVDMLLDIGRVPEAALFARTYVPSRIGEVVAVWKKELSNISEVLSQSLADPTNHPEGFPHLDEALQAEQQYQEAFAQHRRAANAGNYGAYVAERTSLMNEAGEIDVVALLQNGQSLVSGPGFVGGGSGSSSSSSSNNNTPREEVTEEVTEEVAEDAEEDHDGEEVQQKQAVAEVVQEEEDVAGNDLLDEEEEQEEEQEQEQEEEEEEEEEEVAPPPAAPAAPQAAAAPPSDDDEDLDDLLGDSDEDLKASGDDNDDDIDLDDLGLDDDDEWS
jgi:coatomer subunit beta'